MAILLTQFEIIGSQIYVLKIIGSQISAAYNMRLVRYHVQLNAYIFTKLIYRYAQKFS